MFIGPHAEVGENIRPRRPCFPMSSALFRQRSGEPRSSERAVFSLNPRLAILFAKAT